MATAYASAVIDAPVERVWRVIRDFNGLPAWIPAIVRSEIEGGRSDDAVGAIRSFFLADGTNVREQLVALDDQAFTQTYTFVTPSFPVENYVATMRLAPVSETAGTFVEWSARFDEKPEDAGKFSAIISRDIFAGGLVSLRNYIDQSRGRQ
jgi:hypothetical protein